MFSLLKHYLELYITDKALKVSPSLYCFTTSISHGVEIISPGCGVRASLMLFLLFEDILMFTGLYLRCAVILRLIVVSSITILHFNI